MQCYCNKCGRKIVMTLGELKAQRGQVVCPQCLSVFSVPISRDETPPPIPSKSRKGDDVEVELLPMQQHRASSHQSSAVKVAAQRQRQAPRQAVAATQYNRAKASSSSARKSTSRPARKSSTTRKPAAKKSVLGFGFKNMTTLGCLILSAVIVLVFFIFYYIIGQLML